MKARRSCVDDVPTGQPALALAQKVLERVAAAGLPADLIPAGADDGHRDAPAATPKTPCAREVLEFMDTVRKVEQDVAASRRGRDVPEQLDVAVLGAVTEEEWRAASGGRPSRTVRSPSGCAAEETVRSSARWTRRDGQPKQRRTPVGRRVALAQPRRAGENALCPCG